MVFDEIDGLTIENRVPRAKGYSRRRASPSSRSATSSSKGPTTTPAPAIPGRTSKAPTSPCARSLTCSPTSAPVKVPEKGIDWTFFRENTEGAYTLGSQGVNVSDDLAVDFTVTTTQGTERIARLAYDYAQKNGKNRVSIITKANVIKTTDGKFLKLCQKIGEEYPGITTDDWYIDITTAKLIDEKRRKGLQVFVLPNLYGDIITDEAAEFQGGVGTAGSANLGKRYAMFEAIHGSAPRMMSEGRGQYADPCSMLRGHRAAALPHRPPEGSRSARARAGHLHALKKRSW